MKLYEDYTQTLDSWNITSNLKLEDDGRFSYDETWADYTNATVGGIVEGSWRREGDAIILHPHSVEGTIGRWVVGQERRAVERGDILDFGNGFKLHVPPERDLPP